MVDNAPPLPEDWFFDEDNDIDHDPDPPVLCPACQSGDLIWRYDITDDDWAIAVGMAFKCADCGHRFDYY